MWVRVGLQGDVFQGLAALVNLRQLDLHSTQICNSQLAFIPSRVKHLNLMETNIDAEGVHIGLRHLRHLVTINLSGTGEIRD